MRSPRFTVRSLLIVLAVAALWLSSLAGYPGASIVRPLVILAILVASGVAAASCDGGRRAFWSGFFLTVFVAGLNRSAYFNLSWITNLLNSLGQYQNLPNGFVNKAFVFYLDTIRALFVLLVATGMGSLGTLIYAHIERSKDEMAD